MIRKSILVAFACAALSTSAFAQGGGGGGGGAGSGGAGGASAGAAAGTGTGGAGAGSAASSGAGVGHPAAPIQGRRLLQEWGRIAPPPGPTSTPTEVRTIRTFSRRLRTARRRQRRKPSGTLVLVTRRTDCRSALRAPGPAMKIRNSLALLHERPAQRGPFSLPRKWPTGCSDEKG